jgi:mannose-6-phosphate isomerase
VGPGVFLYEVQQPSDLTYRCDDWGRPATPGRPLHIEQALASVRPASRPRLRAVPTADRATVVACEHFILERLTVVRDRPAVLDPEGASLHVLTAIDGPVRILPVASGNGRASAEPMVLGGLETAVISADATAYAIDAPGDARVLLARVP